MKELGFIIAVHTYKINLVISQRLGDAVLIAVCSDWMQEPSAPWGWALALHWQQRFGAGTTLQANELSA